MKGKWHFYICIHFLNVKVGFFFLIPAREETPQWTLQAAAAAAVEWKTIVYRIRD